MTMTEKRADTKVGVKAEGKTVMERTGGCRLRGWDPFEISDEMQDEVARLWGQAWPLVPQPFNRPPRRRAPVPTLWAPSMDTFEP